MSGKSYQLKNYTPKHYDQNEARRALVQRLLEGKRRAAEARSKMSRKELEAYNRSKLEKRMNNLQKKLSLFSKIGGGSSEAANKIKSKISKMTSTSLSKRNKRKNKKSKKLEKSKNKKYRRKDEETSDESSDESSESENSESNESSEEEEEEESE